MYLHIGKDCVINNKDVIGIFNLDYIGNTKEYRNMKQFLEENNKLQRISGEQEKTFILLENNKNQKAYITGLSVSSVKKHMLQ